MRKDGEAGALEMSKLMGVDKHMQGIPRSIVGSLELYHSQCRGQWVKTLSRPFHGHFLFQSVFMVCRPFRLHARHQALTSRLT